MCCIPAMQKRQENSPKVADAHELWRKIKKKKEGEGSDGETFIAVEAFGIQKEPLATLISFWIIYLFI